MTNGKGRPARGGPEISSDHHHQSRRPAAERPETIDQARRWDVVKARAIAFGMCNRCAAQYAWGLQIGFARSHPPCGSCALLIGPVIGEARPNGWKNLHLENVGPAGTGKCPHAYRSRNATPEKYAPGYGTCQCGAFWSGFEVCHCAGCHQTFTTERAFAQHRIRSRCQDPATRGLVKITRAHWVGWGWPAQRDRLERIRG
jgi:hypothetical protein